VRGRGRGSRGLLCQRNTNWGHEEVMTLINYKHKEQIALKQIIDPHANMILAIQQWDKLLDDLQVITQSKTPRIGKICKDKWNCIHVDYKYNSYYHKGIGNNTSY
jgi:hypothetical protein